MKENDCLSVPKGYFEESFEKTMQMARRSRSHKRALLASCLTSVLLAASILLWNHIAFKNACEDYMAQQKAVVELDVFLEIN